MVGNRQPRDVYPRAERPFDRSGARIHRQPAAVPSAGCTVTMLDAVELELYKRLPGDLSILTPSPASDTDTVTVTAETAAKWNLKTIADLAAHSPEVKFAAPVGFSSPAVGFGRPPAEIRAGDQPGQLHRDQRRRRCGHRSRTGGRDGQRGQHLQHLTGHPAEPSRGARRSTAQLPGRKHCAAGEFAEEIRSAQRRAGRGISQTDQPRRWPISTPRCRATPASTPIRQPGTGCMTTASTIRSGVEA